MHVIFDHDRLRILLPELGLTLKLARPQFEAARGLLADGFGFLRSPSTLSWRERVNILSSESFPLRLKRLLLQGVIDNLSEARFSARHPTSEDIARTFWSLGVVNAQAFAGPSPMTDRAVLWSFMQLIFDGDARSFRLHLSNPRNFGEINRRFVMVNYADPGVQELLRQHDGELTEVYETSRAYAATA